MAHADAWKYCCEWSTKTTKRSDWHVIKFLADVMDYTLWLLLNGVYKPMDFDIDISNDNEIFSSLYVAVPSRQCYVTSNLCK